MPGRSDRDANSWRPLAVSPRAQRCRLVGRLWIWSAQREFAALLASFLDLRLPIASAVRHTGEIMSDRNVASACRRVAQRLETAQPLSESLAQSMHFDPSLVAFVAWGERHGLLTDALRIAADVFEDRVEQHASLLHRLLPPIVHGHRRGDRGIRRLSA